MPAKEFERILKWAEYAAIEELIEGHPRGNFSQYAEWCFNAGENSLKQYMLKNRATNKGGAEWLKKNQEFKRY